MQCLWPFKHCGDLELFVFVVSVCTITGDLNMDGTRLHHISYFLACAVLEVEKRHSTCAFMKKRKKNPFYKLDKLNEIHYIKRDLYRVCVWFKKNVSSAESKPLICWENRDCLKRDKLNFEACLINRQVSSHKVERKVTKTELDSSNNLRYAVCLYH